MNPTPFTSRRYKNLWLIIAFVALLCVGAVISLVLYSGCSKNDNHELYSAIASLDAARVQQILASGSSPNSRERCYFDDGGEYPGLRTDPETDTPLGFAIKSDATEIVRSLLTAGADPNLAGEDGTPPLMTALTNVRYAVVPLLLARGANPNWHDPKTGLTLLMISAQTNALPNMKALLGAGADPKTHDRQGKTALSYAFSDGEARGLLLKYGAIP